MDFRTFSYSLSIYNFIFVPEFCELTLYSKFTSETILFLFEQISINCSQDNLTFSLSDHAWIWWFLFFSDIFDKESLMNNCFPLLTAHIRRENQISKRWKRTTTNKIVQFFWCVVNYIIAIQMMIIIAVKIKTRKKVGLSWYSLNGR